MALGPAGRLCLLLCLLASPGIAPSAAQSPAQSTGTYNALVIFARFADEAPSLTTKPSWADDLFDPDIPGSFRHFYDEMSGGQLRVGGQVLPRRYASREPASAYLARTPGGFGDYARFNLEILEQADADVDMGLFDNDGPDGVPNSGDDDGYVDIVFINLLTVPRDFLIGSATGLASLGLSTDFLSDDPAAGGGVIRVRSQYSGFGGTTQRGHVFRVTAGTMCHEFGHVLGLTDLFDQSSVSAAGDLDPVEDSAGIGKWGLMGLGTLGWGVEDGPTTFSAHSLAQLGWLGDGNARLDVVRESRPGEVLAPIDRGGRVLKIPLTDDEYFLVENRQAGDSWYNRNIPAGGLLIWHVDDRADNDEERHKQVDLVCADGLWADGGGGQVADPVAGGDHLDFWARDAAYAQQHNGNQGDATDPFDGITYRRFAWETNPGARAHAGPRRGVPLGLVIDNITPMADGSMSFDLLLDRPVEGNVTGDVRWQGVVQVDGDIVVEPGATLTLAAGTQVRFQSGDARAAGFDTTRSELILYGDLVIEGTAADPVRLERQGNSGREWLGILLPGASSPALEEALDAGRLELEGARLGIARGALPPGRTLWRGVRSLPWDVVVPAGAQLQIDAGAEVRAAAEDLSFRGRSPGFTELIIEGELLVSGTASSPTLLTVDSANPSDLWYGVRLARGGSVDASFLTLTQAGVGFGGEVEAPFRLTDSRLRRLAAGLRLTLFGDAVVRDVDFHTITTQAVSADGFGTLFLRGGEIADNGREGIRVRNAGLQVIDARIVGNGSLSAEDPRSGLIAEGGRGQRIEVWNSTVASNRRHGADLDGWEGVFELHGSSLTGNREDGLRADGAERVVFEEVEVARNLGVGARLVSTISEIWTTTFDDNLGGGLTATGGFPAVEMSHFRDNGLVLTDVARASVRTNEFLNATVGLLTTDSAPQIVANTFSGNVTALRVAGSTVPEQITGNTFTANATALDNRSGTRLNAAGNWWGTLDSTAIAAVISGAVDISPWLTGEPTMTAVLEGVALPEDVALGAAWPNPFNATTTIPFALPGEAAVELILYDGLGRRVRDLSPATPLAAGRHALRWHARDDAGRPVGSGAYFYVLQAGQVRATGRVLLIR
jgi:M6 family metalloprotease-like protein